MKVFVFDLDDTLAPERDFVLSGIRAVHGLLRNDFGDTFADEAAMAMAQAVHESRNHYAALETLSARRLADGRIPRLPDMPRVVATCRSHRPDAGYRLRPGMEELLTALAANGERVGLITDGRSVTQRHKIEALGLRRWVSEADIRLSEEVGTDKRHPDSFLHFMHRYPQAEEYIYIGDNPAKDFESPNRLGWTTVMLRDPDGRNIHPQPLVFNSSNMPSRGVTSLADLIPKMGIHTEIGGTHT